MCLAVPGRVLSVDDTDPLRPAKVDFSGVTKQVALVYTPDAKVGDYVIVHIGFALSRLDEDEAMKTLEELRRVADTMTRMEPA